MDRINFRGSILVWFVQYIIWTTLLVTVYFYSYNKELSTYIEKLLATENLSIKLGKQIIIKDMEIIRSDVLGLTHHEALYKLSISPTTTELESLSREFFLFSLTGRGVYDQVRFLDSEGMEIVRINYIDGQPVKVPPHQLQNKVNRNYFKDAIVLERREILISPFDLNTEKGQVEQPIKPILRFATPVFDYLGRKRGIVILNYLGSTITNNFYEASKNSINQPMLMNDSGYWLFNNNKDLAWGFMYGREPEFTKDYPLAWKVLEKKDKGQIQTDAGFFTFDTVNILNDSVSGDFKSSRYFPDTHTSAGNNPASWKIISHLPSEILDAEAARIYNNLTTIFLPFFILLTIVHITFNHFRKQHKNREFIFNRVMKNSINEVYIFNAYTLLFNNVNQGALNNIGYTLNEMKTMTPVDIIPDFSLEAYEKLLTPLRNNEIKELIFETIHQRKDGSQYPIEAHLQLMAGGEELFTAFILDISTRKKTAEQLNQLADMVSCSKDMVALIDTNYRHVTVNRAYGEMLSLSSENIIGRTVADVVGEDYFLNQVKLRLDECFSGKTVSFETVYSSSPHDKHIFNISFSPYAGSNKIIKGAIVSARDITENEMLKSSKIDSIGLLAGGIAHDFNNILTGLFGNIQLAQLKLSLDHPAYKHIENASIAMSRAKSLTGQLLTFSKGGQPLLEVEDIKPVILDSVKLNLSGSDTESVINLCEDLWRIKIDKGQLSQVFSNILINAIQAMPDGGKIYIDATNEIFTNETATPFLSGNFVKICIRDEGIGISKENLNDIFVPYYSTKKTGNGLGLASSLSVIKKHQGEIMVDSEVGAGTSFTIYLPAYLTVGSEKVIQSTDKINAPANAAHILLMDDEKMIRILCTEMLDSFGCTVESAKEGNEAIDMYLAAKKTSTPFDIVIMDLTVPGGMGGVDAVKKLLSIENDAKVIVSSGYSNDDAMANYAKYGFAARLTKPFKLQELQKEIAQLL